MGTEATGSLWWFEKLLFDNGMTLKIGDPRMIRRAALSRHKNDHRDAETILDLLMRDISGDHAENEQSREMLDLLNYRHSLVSKRTSVVNQLQAFARSKGLPRFRLPAVKARKKIEEVETTQVERLLVSSRFVLCDELTRRSRPWRRGSRKRRIRKSVLNC
ncbi:MAG: transposase [Chloracidobacterium sp.]|nr:transposase [Chloracidobacterium sp.]